MTILVFGADGQVGRALARGSGIRALDRGAADLRDPERCAAQIAAAGGDVVAVINAAAFTAVDAAETNLAEAMRVNGEAPAAMARAAAARGLPFVQLSTDYVFSGDGTAPWRPDDAVAPLNAYGRTKAAGESGVRAAGGCHAILRTSWVFAAEGRNFVATIRRLAAERPGLAIVADQIGGPTPADALAAACRTIALALRADPGLTGIYHFAGLPEVSWAAFARAIIREAGLDCAIRDISTAAYPTPARRPHNSRLDCSSLTARFGLARPDWRPALAAILAPARM